jgi:hypothetical protein
MRLLLSRAQQIRPAQLDRKGRVEQPGGASFSSTARFELSESERQIVDRYGLGQERATFDERRFTAVNEAVVGGWDALTTEGLARGVDIRSNRLGNVLASENVISEFGSWLQGWMGTLASFGGSRELDFADSARASDE